MTKIAINGFGRIGRVLTRVIQQYPEIQLVAINDLADAKTLAHLLKYDSIHRLFPKEVLCNGDNIIINGKPVRIFKEKDPSLLPWKELEVDIVIESTGLFTDKLNAGKHILAGAKKVIISAPPKDAEIKSVVMGINDFILDGTEEIISNASCTTNCAAPMVKVLDELCGIESGYIITIHSYTTDQRLQDAPHKDLRRARAAAESIVPTSTGAAKAITKIFPHLEGKLGGSGIRVPVPDGSLTDVTCTVKNVKSIEEINNAFKTASENSLKQILQYCSEPIVSSDVIGNPYSCTFDTELTSVIGKMVQVVGWSDNEMGYSSRLADLIIKIS